MNQTPPNGPAPRTQTRAGFGFDAYDGFGGVPPNNPPPSNAGQMDMPDPTGGKRRGQDAAEKISRMLQFEGPRGYSTRGAIFLRYISYGLVIALASATTQVFTRGGGMAEGGGKWMAIASLVMLVTATVATFFFPHLRPKIIAQLKQYLFGITVLPGTALAALIFMTRDLMGGDAFASTLSIGLTMLFVFTVGFPVLIYIKVMSDLRTLYRSTMDDQEAVALYARQDGLQR